VLAHATTATLDQATTVAPRRDPPTTVK